jgi:hypothetical protein
MKSEIKNKGNTEEKSKGGFKERREKCIKESSKLPMIDIKGKKYATVAIRHLHLLKYFPEVRVDEQMIESTDKFVITKTTLYIGETPFAVGHAKEIFGSNFINRTSAVENSFTSSLGRAISSFGIHGSEYASAEELANALIQQKGNGKVNDLPIEKQTTITTLNSLYSDWKKKNDLIEDRFKKHEKTITEKGGTYARTNW